MKRNHKEGRKRFCIHFMSEAIHNSAKEFLEERKNREIIWHGQKRHEGLIYWNILTRILHRSSSSVWRPVQGFQMYSNSKWNHFFPFWFDVCFRSICELDLLWLWNWISSFSFNLGYIHLFPSEPNVEMGINNKQNNKQTTNKADLLVQLRFIKTHETKWTELINYLSDFWFSGSVLTLFSSLTPIAFSPH